MIANLIFVQKRGEDANARVTQAPCQLYLQTQRSRVHNSRRNALSFNAVGLAIGLIKSNRPHVHLLIAQAHLVACAAETAR